MLMFVYLGAAGNGLSTFSKSLVIGLTKGPLESNDSARNRASFLNQKLWLTNFVAESKSLSDRIVNTPEQCSVNMFRA